MCLVYSAIGLLISALHSSVDQQKAFDGLIAIPATVSDDIKVTIAN
jgi:hypothetical protein